MRKIINNGITFLCIVSLIVSGFLFDTKADSVGKVSNVSVKTLKGNSWGMSFTSGYKISWKKLSNVTGYKVYAYGPASKKMRCIKTTKSNSYTLTNLLSRDVAKIKIRAYKKSGGKVVYGNYSKQIKRTAHGDIYNVSDSGYCKKSFEDRYAAEQAFVYQNKIRKSNKAKSLKWSKVIYEICQKRARQIVKKFNHSKFNSTAKSHLKKKYSIKSIYAKFKKGNTTFSYPLVGGENIAYGYGDYKSVMKEWKKSPGHFKNMKNKKYKYGAVACYMSKTKGVFWTAIFSEVNVDKYVKDKGKVKKASVKDSDLDEESTVEKTTAEETTVAESESESTSLK